MGCLASSGGGGWGLARPVLMEEKQKQGDSKDYGATENDFANASPSVAAPTLTVLFDGEVPVRLIRHSKEEERTLTLRLELESPPSSSCTQKRLRFRLTDERDAFFLHYFDLDEAGYKELRHRQRINCDFAGFPKAFIETVQLCQPTGMRDRSSLSAQSSSSRTPHYSPMGGGPVFRAEMTLGDDELPTHPQQRQQTSFVNILTFLQIHTFTSVVLKLHFCRGDEAALRKHLAETGEGLKRKCREHEKSLMAARRSVQNLSLENDKLRKTLEKITLARDQDVKQVELKMQAKMNQAAKEGLERQKQLEETLEAKSRGIEHDLKTRLTASESTCEGLKKSIKLLETQSVGLEGERDRLKARVEVLEEEKVSTAQELKKTRNENAALETKAHGLDLEVQKQRVAIAEFKQEVKFKQETIAQLSKQGEDNASDKKRMDEQLTLNKQNINEQDRRIRELESQVKERNMLLITANQDKSRADRKAEDAARDVKSLRTQLEALTNANRDFEAKIKLSEHEHTKSKDSLEALKSTLSSERGRVVKLVEEVKKQRSLIEYLQKQLNKFESPFTQAAASLPIYNNNNNSSTDAFVGAATANIDSGGFSPSSASMYKDTFPSGGGEMYGGRHDQLYSHKSPIASSSSSAYGKYYMSTTEDFGASVMMATPNGPSSSPPSSTLPPLGASLPPLGEVPSPEKDLDFSYSSDVQPSAYFGRREDGDADDGDGDVKLMMATTATSTTAIPAPRFDDADGEDAGGGVAHRQHGYRLTNSNGSNLNKKTERRDESPD
eukprot:jgi/Bigna1/133206/aug1.20_g7914